MASYKIHKIESRVFISIYEYNTTSCQAWYFNQISLLNYVEGSLDCLMFILRVINVTAGGAQLPLSDRLLILPLYSL